MHAAGRVLLVLLCFGSLSPAVHSQNPQSACPRPAPGSAIVEPADLRSENGVLKTQLFFRKSVEAGGTVRYCYFTKDNQQSPTLRVKPGDQVILELKNEVPPPPASAASPHAHGASDACAGGGAMVATATNLHYHGLTVPAACHQDDVLKTSVLPNDPPFEYKFQIPANQPPGLYWYHPHIHGFSKEQVLGGASGALIVEGLERANKQIAGLPERVLIIRDQDLLYPNAQPANGPVQGAQVVIDKDGDALNTGDGSGKPAKDLSLNFVPVPYPDYEPAKISVKPNTRELWRILNASAITYLNIQFLRNSAPQWIPVVAIDGVPINYNGRGGQGVVWQTHVGLPPGGRVEIVFVAPSDGSEIFSTRSVNTGPGGENDPVRPIANVVVSPDAPEPRTKLAASSEPLLPPSVPWLGSVAPAHTRKLYFSEVLQDPKDPNSPTTFFLTVDGEEPKPFDPNARLPNIVAHQGDVEDWIIENRSQELHDFHIHQTHFLLLERFNVPVNEPFLRDTVNIPFWDGKTPQYPSVKLRMDFRDPNAVGTYPYHCHLLEHEDNGMMGVIRVEPSSPPNSSPAAPPAHAH